MIKAPSRKLTALLFLGIFACYLALSPNTTSGRGYVGEEIDSGMKMLEIFNAWVKGRPAAPMVWGRHGSVSVLLDLPFIKIGKLLVSPDFMMSTSPIFFTTALLTLLYVWLRKLASPGISLLLTLTAAFGTMLWPYAYIGLETKQSFSVMLAGYLGLADGKIRSWPKLILFGVACGLAMTVKSTGIVFGGVVVYLLYVQFREEWRSLLKLAAVSGIVTLSVWALGDLTRRQYWASAGGGPMTFISWMADSPLEYFANAIGIFGSPTKGVLVFAPVLLLALFAVPQAWRTHREITSFALLVTGSIVTLVSLLVVSADETPASRYMHVAIAPLVLCLGAAWSRSHWGHYAALVILALLGVGISFLGAFSYYGVRSFAMYDSGVNTVQWNFGDPSWNEVSFNARRFRLWLNHCPSTPWTARYIWMWEAPPGAVAWKSIELNKYCDPQSYLLRDWNNKKLQGVNLTLFRVSEASLAVGILALLYLAWVTSRESWAVLHPFKRMRLTTRDQTES